MTTLTLPQLSTLIRNQIWMFQYSHALVNRETVDGKEHASGWLAVQSSPCDAKEKFQLTHIKWFDCVVDEPDSLTITEADHPWQVTGASLIGSDGEKLSHDELYDALNKLLSDTMHTEVSASIMNSCRLAA